jgi:uncharacterized protein with GYD domain
MLCADYVFIDIAWAVFAQNRNARSRVNVTGGWYMPIYVLLSTLTDEGRKTVKERPKRIKEVNKEIEGLGVKVLSQYAVLGPYDFVNIVQAPDNKTIARMSLELGSRGTVQIMSLAAIPIDEFIESLKKK